MKQKSKKMNNLDIYKANEIVDSINTQKNIKRIKNEKGLIERVELNKVVLTENDKLLLND